MVYSFEKSELNNILTLSKDERWQEVYSSVIDLLTDDHMDKTPIPGVDPNVYTWLIGAKGVNANEGGFAEFIRGYAYKQYEYRVGEVGDDIDQLLQNTSDKIIEYFVKDMFGVSASEAFPEEYNGPVNIPNIYEVGLIDGGAAVSELFSGVASSTDEGNYSPWPGTVLFARLGVSQFFEDWVLDLGVNDKKQEEGTYDLISAAQATVELKSLGLVFNTLNSGELPTYLETLFGGLGDSVHLIDKTSSFFTEAYGEEFHLDPIGLDVFSDISGGAKNTVSSILFGEKEVGHGYRVGTIYSDSDEDALLLKDSDRVVNSGAGDDTIKARFDWNYSKGFSGTPNILDGSAGEDTVDYSSLNVSLNVEFDDHGAFGGRAVVNKPFGFIFNAQDALYNIENLVLTEKNDKVNILSSQPIPLEHIDLGKGSNSIDFVYDYVPGEDVSGRKYDTVFNFQEEREDALGFFSGQTTYQSIFIDDEFSHEPLKGMSLSVGNELLSFDGESHDNYDFEKVSEGLVIDWWAEDGIKDMQINISGWQEGDFGLYIA